MASGNGLTIVPRALLRWAAQNQLEMALIDPGKSWQNGVNGGTNDFVFPGGVVLKAAGEIDLSGVLVNQGRNTAGKTFQSVYLEAPAIGSSLGNIMLYSNDLNWVNFSTFPTAPVRAFTLIRNGNGTASFATADSTAPHLNTYSILSTAAANGQCWTCLVNTQPVNMFGP